MQQALDEQKSRQERNQLGQYATPYALAREIMEYVVGLSRDRAHLEMLEPACGTGVFFSALKDVAGPAALHGSLGFEIDPHYYQPSAALWKAMGVEMVCGDFLSAAVTKRFPLLVANPPYSRHHHICPETKTELQDAVKEQTGLVLSGLAGLYCYFLLLSTRWLTDGGIACWLIPSEFMDVNYGKTIRRYLLEQVELLRIHRFDENDLQFSDALVSSAVVVFRNRRPAGRHVQFTFGGSFSSPSIQRDIAPSLLGATDKWHLLVNNPGVHAAEGRLLGDYFEVKRGIATGCNNFFVVSPETVARYGLPPEYLTPILPSPRKLQADIVRCNNGLPAVDNPSFLFSTDDDIETIARRHPSVLEYITEGEARGVNKSYICSRHAPWYSCEKRTSAPFVIPYMGRGDNGRRMFRFILNESSAIATNGYLLMYPKAEYRYLFRNSDFRYQVWEQLNTLPAELFLQHGRFYGGGLHKMEPRELLSMPAGTIAPLLSNEMVFVA